MTNDQAPAQHAQAISPSRIRPNPENPRLIFRLDELNSLQESIRTQGILVPLTTYFEPEDDCYHILDGERRWRCSLKLGLQRVPIIVQPKPTKLQNIMMMFAIHNARQDWDPLPTAYKLRELESEFTSWHKRSPKEQELAELASISRGEVRRLRNLLRLPRHYRDELMSELEKPRSKQVITVDHVLETTRGVDALLKREVIETGHVEPLRKSIISKFRTGVIKSTVDPRKLVRIARAVERNEVHTMVARAASVRLIEDQEYSIDQAFNDSAAMADQEHSIHQLVVRVERSLAGLSPSTITIDSSLYRQLRSLRDKIDSLIE